MTPSLRIMLDALELAGCPPKGSRGSFTACCPAHADSSPSLSIKAGDAQPVLFHCFAGCQPKDIMHALDLEWKDLLGERDMFDGSARTPRRVLAVSEPAPHDTSIDWEAGIKAAEERLFNKHELFDALVNDTGIGYVPLGALRAGWSEMHQAYTFPMWDSHDRIIGVRLRNASGRKWAVTGSRNGLFGAADLARGIKWYGGPLFVCEGPTDTAALSSLGCVTVGRASCNSGAAYLVPLCQSIGCEVVLMSDSDRAGLKGAESIAAKLAEVGVVSRIVEPTLDGCKDVRDLVRLGATKETVLSLCRAQCEWSAAA